MSAYFEFLRLTLTSIFTELFSAGFAPTFAKIGDAFNVYSASFGVGGWIVFVIMLLLLIGLIGALIAVTIYFIRHAARNKAKKGTEKAMMEEIERLNLELYDVVREKDRILGLHTSDRTSFGNAYAGGAAGGEGGGVLVAARSGRADASRRAPGTAGRRRADDR